MQGLRIPLRPFRMAVPILLAGAALCTAAQPPSPADKKALDDFSRKIKQYVSMQHALPADKMKPTADMAALEQERATLRAALKQARLNAKQGDLFTPEAARVFRSLLAQALSGPDGAKIKASLAHAEPGAPVQFAVNGVYPDTAGQPIQSMPPSLLLNLPVLPKGLEYSLAGRMLALRDSDANMVVDYLPNALP